MEQIRKRRNNYSQLFYDKGGDITQCWKNSLLNKRCWENWTVTCERMKLGHFLTSYTKISSNWIKDLYVRLDYTTLRGKHRQNTL